MAVLFLAPIAVRGLRGKQHPHCHKTQPEPGLQQAPRIQHHHHSQHCQPHHRPRPCAPLGTQKHHHQQHANRALGRNAPPAEHGIHRGQAPASPCRCQRRWQPQATARTAPPSCIDQRHSQPRKHCDVQATDADQVGNARISEQLPICTRDAGLRPCHQGLYHAPRCLLTR